MAWLLDHPSTDEFNRMLQVVRPCTDEPRLLSAIASLVATRTLLIQPLYAGPPYADFRAFVTAFHAVELEGDQVGARQKIFLVAPL